MATTIAPTQYLVVTTNALSRFAKSCLMVKIQLDYVVDLKICCKLNINAMFDKIWLQIAVPMQPKMFEFLLKK